MGQQSCCPSHRKKKHIIRPAELEQAPRSRGLASNLILYDVAPGELAQANEGSSPEQSLKLSEVIGVTEGRAAQSGMQHFGVCAGLPVGGSGAVPSKLT